ncbi:histone acetyltransferase p300-like [Cydia fagiglandana]|uniref:histone acetyltransferase p300-like n=1 Tax=Cydia fagiglandana TaxID=1458189 RepID=UPI002FEDEDBA
MDVPNDPVGHLSNEETRKLIWQQLILLLHAYKCEERGVQQCALPRCSDMKAVLIHLRLCQEGISCGIPHCISSRQLIRHWKTCVNSACPVCSPIKGTTPKEWHQSMREEKRRHLVELLDRETIPDLMSVEKSIYHLADTLENYYRMMAAKMCQEMTKKGQPA